MLIAFVNYGDEICRAADEMQRESVFVPGDKQRGEEGEGSGSFTGLFCE